MDVELLGQLVALFAVVGLAGTCALLLLLPRPPDAEVAAELRAEPARLAKALLRSCRPLRLRRLPDEPRLEDVVLEGTLASGRAASIQFFDDPPTGQVTVHAVRAPRLAIERESVGTRLAKRFGRLRELVIGRRDFDARYLLLTEEVREARRALRAVDLREAIDKVMAASAVERVELDGDDLVASVDATRLAAPSYGRLLRTLDLLADVLQRQRVPVRVLGGERAAMTGVDGTLRCVFCLDEVRVDDDQGLTACTVCATVVHLGCWDEHGGCPVYGCRGGRSERGAQRA